MAKQSLNVDTTETVEERADNVGGGFLQDNVRLLGIIGIILLILVGGLFYYFYGSAESNNRAQIELGRIRPYYERLEYSMAIRGDSSKTFGGEKIHGLQYIVDEWSGTKTGKVAALYLGNSYLALGQPDKARQAYEIATGADDELVRSAAHAGLGAVSEATGKYEAAADEYEKAAAEDRLELNTPEYLVGAARNLERAKKNEEAIKHYRTVATQYANTNSPAISQARMALARHNVEL